MYDELIKNLRICSRCDFGQDCNGCTQDRDDRFCCDILLHNAADAIEGLSHAVDQMTEWRKKQWISVTERLPDGDEDVLVTDGNALAVGYYRPDANAWDSCEFGWIENRPDPYPSGLGTVTHWMPLPEPPKDGEE